MIIYIAHLIKACAHLMYIKQYDCLYRSLTEFCSTVTVCYEITIQKYVVEKRNK